MRWLLVAFVGLLFTSCSTSYFSAFKKDQFESNVAVHELRLEVDDLKQSLATARSEIDALEEKLHYQESELVAFKNHFTSQHSSNETNFSSQFASFDKRLYELEQQEKNFASDLSYLRSHATQTTTALTGYRDKISDLEQKSSSQDRRFEELGKIKKTLTTISHAVSEKAAEGSSEEGCHVVQSGDTLDKIAKHHHISSAALKEMNQLSSDTIFIGQKIKVPQ